MLRIRAHSFLPFFIPSAWRKPGFFLAPALAMAAPAGRARGAGLIKRIVKAAGDPEVIGFPSVRRYELDKAKRRLRQGRRTGGNDAA